MRYTDDHIKLVTLSHNCGGCSCIWQFNSDVTAAKMAAANMECGSAASQLPISTILLVSSISLIV